MRRIGRWMLNALTVLSLLLCVGTVVAWLVATAHLRHGVTQRERQIIYYGINQRGISILTLNDWPTVPSEESIEFDFPGRERYWRMPGFSVTSGLSPPPPPAHPVLLHSRGPARRNVGSTTRSYYPFGQPFRPKRPAATAPSPAPPAPPPVGTMIGIAFWLPVALLAFLPTLRLAIKSHAIRRARLRTLRGLCASCAYDLAGNVSGVCPECGTKIAEAK